MSFFALVDACIWHPPSMVFKGTVYFLCFFLKFALVHVLHGSVQLPVSPFSPKACQSAWMKKLEKMTRCPLWWQGAIVCLLEKCLGRQCAFWVLPLIDCPVCGPSFSAPPAILKDQSCLPVIIHDCPSWLPQNPSFHVFFSREHGLHAFQLLQVMEPTLTIGEITLTLLAS